MKSITLRLDPLTRDELYADISNALMDFVLVEAIFNTLNDFFGPKENILDALVDPEYYHNDPEACLASSAEFLLDVLTEMDRQDGVDTSTPEYGIQLQDNLGWIHDKLALAISSITVANNPGDFMEMNVLLSDPSMSQRLTVTGKHLGNTVVLLLSGVGIPGLT